MNDKNINKSNLKQILKILDTLFELINIKYNAAKISSELSFKKKLKSFGDNIGNEL